MSDVLKIASLVFLVIGLILIAISVYLYIKRGIREISKDLKTTKQVAAEKKYDDSLTNSIYYKSEAGTALESKPDLQPKGFKRQAERPARNDTGLLRPNIKQENQPAKNTEPMTVNSTGQHETQPLKDGNKGRMTLPLK